METENKKVIPIIGLGILVLMAVLFFIVWWFTRDQHIIYTITYYVVILMIFGFIGLIIGLVIWFLKPKRKDMLWIAKQRIIKACQSSQPDFVQKLMLLGNNIIETRFIGYVNGICRIKSNSIKQITKDVNGIELLKKIKDDEELFIIAFKKMNGFISGFLSPVELVIGTRDDFTDFNKDTLYIKDICFAPKLYDLLIPSKHFSNTHIIDEPVKELVYRYNLQENLIEMREIASAFLAISPEYQKQKTMSQAQEMGIVNNQKSQNSGK